MADSVHYLNGAFVTEKDLLIPIRDLGYARGYAAFDFLITYGGRPFLLGKHIDRLFNSSALIGLNLSWKKEEVRDWVLQTLAKNPAGEKAIKIIVSGGVSSSLLPQEDPTIVILVDPRSDFPKEYYEKGVAVVTDKFTRYMPSAKTNNYIEGVRQMQSAAKSGAIEPIYYDDSQVFEGATCNIFALIDGKLRTPQSNILSGITRDVLLHMVKLDTPIEIKDLTLDELLRATEVFLTASNKEVMPVVKIDESAVGDGTVGSVTKRVMQQFEAFTQSSVWHE